MADTPNTQTTPNAAIPGPVPPPAGLTLDVHPYNPNHLASLPGGANGSGLRPGTELEAGQGASPSSPPPQPEATPASPSESSSTGSGTGDEAPHLSISDAIDTVATDAKDGARGFTQGAINGVVQTGLSLDHLATAGTNALIAAGVPNPTLEFDENGIHLTFPKTDTEAGELDKVVDGSDQIMPPETTLGHMTEDTSQFLTGMAMFGSVGGLMRNVGGYAAGELSKAALSSAASFDPRADNLSNVIQQYPSLRNPITQYLAADPNDLEATARFKNAMEGTLTGAIGEALFAGVRTFKALRAGKSEEAVTASQETAEALAKTHEPVKTETMVEPEASTTPMRDPDETGQGATSLVPKRLADGRQAFYLDPGQEVRRLNGAQIERFNRDLGPNTDWLTHGGTVFSPHFNTAYLPQDHAYRGVLSTHQDIIGAKPGAMDGPQTWETVQRMARDMVLEPEEALVFLRAMAAAAENMPAASNLARNLTTTAATTVARLSALIAEGNPGSYGSLETVNQLLQEALHQMHEGATYSKKIQTGVGRSLNAQKIPSKAMAILGQFYTLKSYSKDQLQKLAQTVVLMNDGTIQSVLRALRYTNTAIQGLNHILINSLLGLPTATLKTTTDVMMAIVTPMERAMSGGFQAVGGGFHGFVKDGLDGAVTGASPGIARFHEGLGYYAAYAHYIGDAVMMAAKAFKLGRQITQGEGAHSVQAAFGDGTVLNNLLHGNQGHAVLNAISNFVTLPSRVIGSVDEFSKHLAYRAEVYRKAIRDARAAVPSMVRLDGPKAEDAWKNAFVNQRMNRAFDAEGKHTDKDAWHFAETQTNTQDGIRDPEKLGFGATKSLTAFTQDAASSLPVIRQFMPFIKTPMNINRWGWTRTPGLNLLQKEYRSDLLAGGERTADALSKMTTAGTIAFIGMSLAASGNIIGTIHSDPAIQAEIERDTGQRHNSWVITHPDGSKDYVPLSKFADPVGTLLAQAADLYKISHYLPDGEYKEFCAAYAVMIAHGLEDKQYFQGITNAYQAFMGTLDPEATKGERVNKFVAQYLAGYVPNILSNHNEGGDLYMREINGVLDGMLRKLPGSVNVDPVRNDLGEPVTHPDPLGPGDLSPFQVSHEDTGIIAQELGRQLSDGSKPLPRMPKVLTLGGISSGIDTTKIPGNNGFSGYDRLKEIMSQPDGYPSIRQTFEKMFAPGSPYWTRGTDTIGQYQGSRRQMIESTIGQYHRVAQAQFAKENPWIQEAVRQQAMNSAAVKIGRPLPYPDLLKQDAFQSAMTAQPKQ